MSSNRFHVKKQNADSVVLVVAGLCFLTAVISFTGCIPNGATRTTRPLIETSPWMEQTVTSRETGNSYRYMYLKGPVEDAPVAVLLHGGIFDNRIWLYCNDLAKKYTVYAPQYPDSSRLYTGNITDWGKVVKDFVDAVNITPELLAGVSNGAYGAIEYLLQNENRVHGLVLISTVMLSSSKAEIKKRTRMANLALRFSPTKLQGLVESRATGTNYGEVPGTIKQSDIFYVRPYSYYYQLFSVPHNQGARKQATERIKIPVLILHGEEDKIMPLWVTDLTVAAFPHATLKKFKSQGHDMVFSIGPEIAQTILDFFGK